MRWWARCGLGSCIGLALLAPGAPAQAEQLSDETSVTRWASPLRDTPVLRRPQEGARRVGTLRRLTEDGLPEVIVLLERTVRPDTGREWLRVRVPGRPNGRTGWVRREAMSGFRLVRTHLRINRRTLRATLYHSGRRIWRARIGVGAPGTPTPAGRFWIRERIRGRGGIYGPVAFGTAAYSRLSEWPGGGVIGIHGTNQPGLIPGRPSHGCIRIRNRDILRLARRMPIGTPVRIL